MKKQFFLNGSPKSEKVIVPVKSEKVSFIEGLERITSVVDFYRNKEKILEHLRGTRK